MVALIAALGNSYGLAQQTTADVLGRVTDTSGSVIPNAAVTVENLGTHETRKVTTTDSGDYVVNLLKPGTYSVTITSTGFKTYQIPQLTLAAGDRERTDISLSAGASNETVNVEAQASELKTDSSVLSTTIGQQATQDVPLNGRNFVQLVQFTPGANEGPATSLVSGNSLDDRRQSASISVNGQSELLNNEMIDGVDNNERLIGTIAVRPALDSISEISVQTNTYTAEVGRTGGGIVNVITKSGSNKFHGTVFEFLRNDALDANVYSFGANLKKVELRQNQFGASLGGPILHDKTFFFGDYEGYRQVRGTNPQQLTVPTLYEHNHPGDFSDVGGTALAPAQQDKAGLAYLSMLPAPNSGTNQYIGSFNNIQNSDDFSVRVDHQFNPNNQLYGRFLYNKVTTDSPGVFPDVQVSGLTLNPNSDVYVLAGSYRDLAYTGLLNYIHTFTPNLLLELKASYTRLDNEYNAENQGLNPNEAFGQPNVNSSIGNSTGLAPINVLAGTVLGSTFYQPGTDLDNTFQYMGAVTWTKHSHNFKFGSGIVRRQLLSSQNASGEGYWIFSDYQALAQGQYSSVSRSVSLVDPRYRVWEPHFYAQDDWHITSKLTLNMGLRYEWFTPYTELHNNISNWDPITESLLIAGQGGVSSTAGVKTDHHGLAPRFGFAYQPGWGMVVRGGYGIGFFPMNTTSAANLKNMPFVSAMSACSYQSCGGSYTSFQAGLPAIEATTLASANAAISSAVDTHFRTSYIHQFNLTVQKEFASNVITLTYVGLLGRHMAQILPSLNAPPPNTCGTDATCYNPLRPYYAKYPNLGTVAFLRSGGVSSYNSFQASIERRLTNGLTLNVNYNYARNLDNYSPLSANSSGGYGALPNQVSTLEYGNSNLDLRQRIAGTITYALPFGKNLHGVSGVAAKGWQVNVLGALNGGLPFSVVNATSVSNTEPGVSTSDRPNQIGSSRLSNRTTTKFFNTASFQAQAAGTIGNERRNQLYGPHYRHLDLSLFKTFPIYNQVNLEFRAESFNLTNTSNFGQPNSTLNGSNFGAITSLSNAYTPREIQFALKLTY